MGGSACSQAQSTASRMVSRLASLRATQAMWPVFSFCGSKGGREWLVGRVSASTPRPAQYRTSRWVLTTYGGPSAMWPVFSFCDSKFIIIIIVIICHGHPRAIIIIIFLGVARLLLVSNPPSASRGPQSNENIQNYYRVLFLDMYTLFALTLHASWTLLTTYENFIDFFFKCRILFLYD
ncbi:hypothetical protein T492DRAFT_977104 [Pavlovales sp. CCMP2436]|nr:hypothetical protein T492DRAFT_977104 [Pavlovales sp. CCMP2436]